MELYSASGAFFSENQNEIEKLISDIKVEIDGVLLARNIGNEQADVANADFLQNLAESIQKEHQNLFKIKVISGEELKEQNLNLIYAVGQAATVAPRLVILEYTPAGYEPPAGMGSPYFFGL